MSKALLGNFSFWVFCLYIVAIVLATLRLIIRQIPMQPISDIHFTIVFNWAATLIVMISTLIPLRLITSYQNTGFKHSAVVDWGNVRLATIAVMISAIVLLVTVLALGLNLVPDKTVLTIWRGVFMFSACLEISLLAYVLPRFKFTSVEQQFKWYLCATLWMRGGIVASNILRFTEVVDSEVLSTIHMTFVISGLVLYNRRISARRRNKVHAKTSSMRRRTSGWGKRISMTRKQETRSGQPEP